MILNSEYTGFTAMEVKGLCDRHHLDFEEFRVWKVEELPSGHGIADIVYFPKRRSPLSTLVVELKWNKSAEGAIRQIKDRNYPAMMREYTGEVISVGIHYDSGTKKHICEIEKSHVSLE